MATLNDITSSAAAATTATTAKRGRKPKAAAAATADGAAPAPAEKAPRAKKAGSAKAVYEAGVAHPRGAVDAPSDDEHVIMKLNVEQDARSGEPCVEEEPNAYNQLPTDSFATRPYELDCSALPPSCSAASSSSAAACAPALVDAPVAAGPRVVHLLKDFEEKNKNNEWPQTTHIACYWCCHRFDTPPFGVPVKYAEGRYHVCGCFCSLECAAAHNFASHDSVDVVWERYHLINMLSRAIGHKAIVKAAPSRLALKLFGGNMEAAEFRAFCHTSKLLNINFPPMMTLTQQLEEVNESDLNTSFKYVPLDTDRINRYKQEKIKLKRNRPITDVENTLEHTMSLAFGKE